MNPTLVVALLALALAACRRTEPAASLDPPRAPPVTTPVVRAGLFVETKQIVTAIIPTWRSTTAELRLWERDGAGAPWRLVLGPWPGVIGKTGAGWGMGLHGRGPFPGRDGPLKVEGDGRSPAGAFLLQGTYGYADSPPAKAGMPYQHTDENWQCVDDPSSNRYNEVLDRRRVEVDWKTAEDMRRADALYSWVVDVAHNPTRIPGGGSCIFLHVWGGPATTTVGCTAMEAPRLEALIQTLTPRRLPVFVLLPRAEYEALAPAWELPAL